MILPILRMAPLAAVFVAAAASGAEARPRPTKASIIACQMGPHFLGAAWRGKRYRPYTRDGRPRVCVPAAMPSRQFLEQGAILKEELTT